MNVIADDFVESEWEVNTVFNNDVSHSLGEELLAYY